MSQIIPNTANEPEREVRSRRANMLDAFGIVCAVLFVAWPFAFGWGVLGHANWVRPTALGAFYVLFAWVLVGSPFWHGDTTDSLGLGNPLRLYRRIRDHGDPERWRLLATFLLVFGGLVFFCLADWPDASKFFRLPRNYREWPDSPLLWTALVVASICASAIVASCAIRYENLGSAFGLALKLSLLLLACAVLAAWLYQGDKAFAKLNTQEELRDHSLDAAAHMFWGLIQQFIFTGFFANRLRKAFAPSLSPGNIIPAGQRWLPVLFGGLVAAAVLGPGMWLAVRAVHGERVPLGLLAGCAGFAFPIGAVWTYFFARDKRRMLVATLSGSFFGLIHIDSYGLVLVTTILGTIFAYAAMEDRFRNLAAFAFVHGLLGATLIKLFAGKGILKISLSVGPWTVKQPSAAVLIVPVVCLVLYAVGALWAARRLRTAEDQTAASA